jgi:poly(3-hydroxybutyrate) depolymerase
MTGCDRGSKRFLPVSTLLAFALTMCAKAPVPATPAAATTAAQAASTAPTRGTWLGSINNQKVTFQSGGLALVGYLFKPAGDGPFPALISNHGSDHYPEQSNAIKSFGSAFASGGM